MYRKTEGRFDIYADVYFKSVIKGFKFVFSGFFPLQIKLLLCNRNNFKKLDAFAILEKSFERNRRIERVMSNHTKR